jgi:hypothetical protein
MLSNLDVVLILVLMVSCVVHIFQFMIFQDMKWLMNHHAEEVQRCWRKIDEFLGIKKQYLKLVKDDETKY